MSKILTINLNDMAGNTMKEAERPLRRDTMQEQGVSKILTINLNDMAKELKIK